MLSSHARALLSRLKFEWAGMWAVKIGGPAYRIGLGGGAASSKAGGEEGSGPSASDFNAVQRGDAEMENRMNRVIRACIEMGDANPIVSIHDQGAGGNGNVLKEIVDPLGGKFEIRAASELTGLAALAHLAGPGELWAPALAPLPRKSGKLPLLSSRRLPQ